MPREITVTSAREVLLSVHNRMIFLSFFVCKFSSAMTGSEKKKMKTRGNQKGVTVSQTR